MKIFLDQNLQLLARNYLMAVKPVDRLVETMLKTAVPALAISPTPKTVENKLDAVNGSARTLRPIGTNVWGTADQRNWTLDRVPWQRLVNELLVPQPGEFISINVETREFIQPPTTTVEVQRTAAVKFARLIDSVRVAYAAIGRDVNVSAYQFPRVDPQQARGRYTFETTRLVDVYRDLTDFVAQLQPRCYFDYTTDSPSQCADWAERVVHIARSIDGNKPIVPWVSVRTAKGQPINPEMAQGVVDGLRAGGAEGVIVWQAWSWGWTAQDQAVLDVYLDAAGDEIEETTSAMADVATASESTGTEEQGN